MKNNNNEKKETPTIAELDQKYGTNHYLHIPAKKIADSEPDEVEKNSELPDDYDYYEYDLPEPYWNNEEEVETELYDGEGIPPFG